MLCWSAEHSVAGHRASGIPSQLTAEHLGLPHTNPNPRLCGPPGTSQTSSAEPVDNNKHQASNDTDIDIEYRLNAKGSFARCNTAPALAQARTASTIAGITTEPILDEHGNVAGIRIHIPQPPG